MTSEALLPDNLLASNEAYKEKPDFIANEPTVTTIKEKAENVEKQPGPSGIAPDDETAERQSNLDDAAKKEQIPDDDSSALVIETEDAKVATDPNGDNVLGDKFVLLNPYSEYNKDPKLRNGFFTQMENVFKLQIDQCRYYKSYFEQQDNEAMSQKFAAYEASSLKYIELLKQSYQKGEMLPAHSWEQISFNCLPVNADVKKNELQLVVKTSDLDVANTANVYIIGEFEFQLPKDEPIGSSFSRWLHHVRIEPKLICCTNNESRQLDIVYGMDVLPFDKPESKYTGYTRGLSFFVDKGKSRTLKRKFKPVKLTFYEKRYLKKDRKIGSAQIKIDQVNDVSTSVIRVNLMDGRRELEAVADVRIRVREPLVDKSVRAYDEKILHLT